MDTGFLFSVFVILAAASVAVPLVNRARLGSVLGYLVAGIFIGPFGLSLINNPEQVMHFAEFGVVMMLFLIGLELEPDTLWRLRKSILGLGSLQVVTTSAAFTGVGMVMGYSATVSAVCGMALSLSSTALVLQVLQEKGLLKTAAGESAFAVLLFQDIAVIPILLVIPLLAGTSVESGDGAAFFKTLAVAGVIVAIVVTGRYLSRHLFYFIAKTNLREIFTATSLALVVGVTLLMQMVGVSPALGAFIAGVVLANSQYRHTLEADIQPFKSLLLGLFFISVGMGIDFSLVMQAPISLLGALALLIAIKAAILYTLGCSFGMRDGTNTLFALSLAQGGEFAFVLFQYAGGLGVVDAQSTAFLTLVVAISMATTPLLMIFNERFVIPRFMSRLPEAEYDAILESNPVIIAGYGRFGQIIGRFLKAQGVKVTVLESDPEQVEFLRKFGSSGYFGDASRLDLLHNAGAAKAKILIVAVDNADKCLEIVRLAREHFPSLKVFARARNRRHAYELHKAGADYYRREMFDASLVMAEEAMKLLGADAAVTHRKAAQFAQHDETTLTRSFEFFEREPELISFSRQATGELERILQDDIQPKTGAAQNDAK